MLWFVPRTKEYMNWLQYALEATDDETRAGLDALFLFLGLRNLECEETVAVLGFTDVKFILALVLVPDDLAGVFRRDESNVLMRNLGEIPTSGLA
jgi:hypothetical protein